MPPIIRSAGLATLFVGLLGCSIRAETTDETVDLTPRIETNSKTRVFIELDAGGSDVVRAEADATGKAAAEQKLPMSVSAKLQYDERRLASDSVDTAQEDAQLAIRYYETAEGVLKVDTTGLAPKLSEDRRVIVVESGAARPILSSPAGTLPREQLDLIDVIGNSCLVDQLLPSAPVAEGASWNHDSAIMGGLLTLDSVAVCEVQSVLDEFNSSFAKIRLAGVVHGAADGAATQQEVRGVYLFDRRLKRITKLNLAVREMRSIGGATPGLDGVSKLQIKIEAIESSPHLTDEVVAAATGSTPAALDLLYESAPLGFRVEHDRQWFITSTARETISMRRVDASDVVAQCSITKLPSKSEGRQTSLEQFQKDVTYSLGKRFRQLISSRQWANAHGHRCFEVVVRGAVDDLPVEWHFYLVAQESGHRVSLAFTIEGPMVERVAEADRQLVEQLQLISPQAAPPQTASVPAESATE